MRRVEHVAHRSLLLIAEAQRSKVHGNGIALQQAHDDAFAMNRRHGRNAQVVFDTAYALPETPVLGQPALGNIQIRHDLNARDDSSGRLQWRRVDLAQQAVYAVADL